VIIDRAKDEVVENSPVSQPEDKLLKILGIGWNLQTISALNLMN